ncbi:MAG: hypothetical protein ACP5N1_06000 [Candidatus Woesearchaeota archaeon]
MMKKNKRNVFLGVIVVGVIFVALFILAVNSLNAKTTNIQENFVVVDTLEQAAKVLESGEYNSIEYTTDGKLIVSLNKKFDKHPVGCTGDIDKNLEYIEVTGDYETALMKSYLENTFETSTDEPTINSNVNLRPACSCTIDGCQVSGNCGCHYGGGTCHATNCNYCRLFYLKEGQTSLPLN